MIKDRLLVLGLGNILMGDDGIGVHVIAELKKLDMTGNVDIIDGGTVGIDILDILSLYRKVFVADAMINSGEDIRLFSVDELLIKQDDSNYSMHDINLTSTISLMKALNIRIPSITILGIPAGDISHGAGLSDDCKRHLSDATRLLVKMIMLFSLNPQQLETMNPDNIMEELHDFL